VDIFISGDLTTCTQSLAEALLADGHRVVASCKHGILEEISDKRFTLYQMVITDPLYLEIFTAHSFDAIIHILPDTGTVLSDDKDSDRALNSAQLEIALHQAKRTGVEKLILLSSIDVYGSANELVEKAQPQPSNPKGQMLLNAENLCKTYVDENFEISIIRIPSLFGPQENYSLISQLIHLSRKKKSVAIPFGKLAHCNFLHMYDMYILIRSILEKEETHQIRFYNLGTEDINYYFLSEQLNIYFPDITYSFAEKDDAAIIQRKISMENARQDFGWQAQHKLIDELPSLTTGAQKSTNTRKPFSKGLSALLKGMKPFLVWVEVILGAFLMHMLTIWTSTIIEFKVIDYRLIFVVLIGSIHGLIFGIIAALLAAASAILSWDSIGLDFALLIYNVENWIPFAVYFLAGAVTGYVHDKHENDLRFEAHQTALIHEKYSFLYQLYNEISSIKNRLRDQLVGYRDSFGRFFRITNELNELDEDNIFYKALEVLEDVMKNDQIAIYSIEQTGNFGRLQVSSKSLTRDIPKSLRLDDYPEALPVLKAGDIFQNKTLIANYPAYLAPIIKNDNLIGLIIIWEARFEQFNLYYFNLFKVITGLIQSALVRAATFENARYEKLFISDTRIMRPDAFKQTFKTRNKMRRKKISQFQILRIPRGEQAWPALYEKLTGSIRSEDVVGILKEKADACYIILSNAGAENIGMIQDRMRTNGISSEYIRELEVD